MFQRPKIGPSVLASVALASSVLVRAALGADTPVTAPHATDVHTPLTIDASLRWADILDATLATYPRRLELAARESEASAWTHRAGRLLAASPSMYFTYLSDSPLDDHGQRDYDAGVELPLWRPGQRAAVRGIAASAGAESAAATAALRLELAGLLRGALWDIEAAVNDLATARESSAVADDLVSAVERRNARGDLPLADALLARSTRLEKRQAVLAREADLLDAERTYKGLTGLDRRPGVLAERLSAREELDGTHPLLALADAEVARARSSVDLIDREARGTLALTVGPHRQRDPFGTIYTDSLKIGVKVPFGGANQSVTQHAEAARVLASAEAQRGQLLRRLDLAAHEAEHSLHVLEESLTLATERRDLSMRQAQMARSAFSQGEIELRELLRIQDSAQNAVRDVRRLEIERQRTIGAYNQTMGETP